MSNKIHLKVKNIAQNSNFDCLLAATQMIINYWENKSSDYINIKKDLSAWVNSNEKTHTQGVAIYLSSLGYKVWFAHHDPRVISKRIDGLTEKDLLLLKKYLKEISNIDENAYRKKKVELDIEYH